MAAQIRSAESLRDTRTRGSVPHKHSPIPVRRTSAAIPWNALGSALALFRQAERSLAAASEEPKPAEKYAAAYLAALRAAAAVLAVRGRPHRGQSRPTSAWVLLTSMAPELREWATFFASGSARRAAIQAGVTRLVSDRDANDLVRQAARFLELVKRVVQAEDLLAQCPAGHRHPGESIDEARR